MRVFFTTDIHGSEVCWRKFVNAGRFYEADVLVLGGDVVGKAVLLVERGEDGVWRAQRGGRAYAARSEAELARMTQEARDAGHYVHVVGPDGAAAFRASEAERERVFEALARASIREWIAFAEQRIDGAGPRVLVTAGNDDPFFLDDAFAGSDVVEYAEEVVAELGDGHEMVSLGWANPTPWHTHRECPEPDLEARIDAQAGRLRDPERAIFNLHVPPYASGLDEAPLLDDDLRPRDGGSTKGPVGSHAVRAAIERYRPMLGLHGHIHEARGATKLGRTVCLNPGSVYGQGLLAGAVAVIKRGKVRGYQLVEG
jgi:Icc-related predicted phosphoesterase